MNKTRILQLIEILKMETDIDHPLSLKDIISKLEERNIKVNNRKTLYDDFRYLNENGYEIEYSDGKYYISESPFSLSEIKIIVDSINSLKNLDDRFLNNLKKKLYSFISKYEATYLKKLEYHNTHSDRKFINRLEDSLQAIRNNTAIIIKRSNHDSEKIFPLFLHRDNDYYYLYYHYPENNKIYHARFDNIEAISHTDETDEITIGKDSIIDHINESSSSFYQDSSTLIKVEICNDSDYLRSRLENDFPNLIYTKNGFSIKASISNALFTKFVSYGTDIRIIDKNIAKQYSQYLNDIIHNNQDYKNT